MSGALGGFDVLRENAGRAVREDWERPEGIPEAGGSMGLVARGGGASGGCSSGGADDEGLSRVMLELEELDGIGGESSGEVPTSSAAIKRVNHESM
jgi:hypothetical protein